MQHPWVTDGGRILLDAACESGPGVIEVTAQEAQGAIDRGSLVSMVRARLKEKTFRAGEYLFREVRGAVGTGSGGWWGLCVLHEGQLAVTKVVSRGEG